MHIRKIEKNEDKLVLQAANLFDEKPDVEATARFLDSETHHIFIAYEANVYEANQPAGFITGVKMTHPDKGTEMFIYELGVDAKFRRQGIGSALLEKMQTLAKERG